MGSLLLEPFRRRPFAADVMLALALFALALALNDVGFERGPIYPWAELPPYWVAVAAVALTMLPVAFRRRLPLTTLLFVVSGLALLRLLNVPEYQLSSIALLFAIYSAGRWGNEKWRDPVRIIGVIGVVAVLGFGLKEERQFLTEGLISERAYVIGSLVGILGNLVFIVAPWVLGNVTRSRAEREQELAEANVQLVASRADAERRAVSDERVRIARELHDVVAHHVSVMGVQAGAARRMIASSPDAVTETLSDIEESSRQAVAELHRLLGFLRSPEDDQESTPLVDTPAPSLQQLPMLQRQVAAAGLAVSLSVLGERPEHIPVSVDVSAYRIVQEALTNALKHSGQHEASVTLTYSESTVEVSIRNDGEAIAAPSMPGSGNGLIGMQERVALHGGELRFGPTEAAGFEVVAVLPLDRSSHRLEVPT